MAASTSIFPFFGLPRELRDRIYVEAGGRCAKFNFQYCRERPTKPPFEPYHDALVEGTITSMPRMNLLLVSQKFKYEYELENREHMVLRVQPEDMNCERLMRRMRPYRPLPEEEERVVHFLEPGSPMHRCFFWIPKVELRLWHGLQCYLHDMYHVLMRYIGPFMTNLKSLKYDYLQKLDEHNFEPDAPKPYLLRACVNKLVAFPGRITPIEFKTRVYLNTPLLSMKTTWQMTPAERENYPSLAKVQDQGSISLMIQDYWSNYAIWKATPSVGEGAMWGVDLTLDSVGGFDLKAFMKKFEPDVRYMLNPGEEPAAHEASMVSST